MLVTYKYYDDKKRRLAISAKPFQEGMTQITIIACSKKDAFSKKKARKALEDIEEKGAAEINGLPVHPETTTIQNYFKDWKKSFFTYANGNFKRVRTMQVIVRKDIIV